jgi:hypothetical protein
VDDAYVKTAAATGGQVLLVGPTETAGADELAITAGVGNRPLVLAASESAAGVAGELPVPVDRSVRRLVITAMFDATGGTLDLTSPDGAPVEASERVSDARLHCGRVVIVDRPDPGLWRAHFIPSGRFWLRVFAESDLDLTDVAFVEPRTGPGLRLPRKAHGSPLAGRPATLRAYVSGPDLVPREFTLLSDQAKPLSTAPLKEAADGSWTGIIDVPSEPFRLAVTGVDAAGVRYQRSSRQIFEAELVEVRPANPEAALKPQAETVLTFTVHNAGPRARFRISTLPGAGLTAQVEPAAIELGEGAEQQVKVWVSAGAAAAPGTNSDLIVTASTDAPRATSNSAATTIRIRN